MVRFVEAAGAGFQFHFLYALQEVVFYSCYFLNWCQLHCPITVGRLHCCCFVWRSAMEWLYIDLVCSHQLFHTPDVWWRQFGWKVLQVEELSNHTHHSHPQAVHLSTTDQPLWGHHALLHKGSFNELHIGFWVWKMIACKLKRKNFIFAKLISQTQNSFVFELLLQMENELFSLEINWTNKILEGFWNGNRIFIKQNWTEWKSDIAKLIVNYFADGDPLFLLFYY